MTESETHNPRRNYIMITGIIVALIAGWFLADYFSLAKNSIPGQLSNPNCDISQSSCTASGGDIAITLDVSPKNIRSLQAMNFKVSVNGLEAESALVDLQGTEMYMGINQTPLEQNPQQKTLFSGKGQLGACVTGEMGWRATVLVNTQQGPVKAWFDFRAK